MAINCGKERLKVGKEEEFKSGSLEFNFAAKCDDAIVHEKLSSSLENLSTSWTQSVEQTFPKLENTFINKESNEFSVSYDVVEKPKKMVPDDFQIIRMLGVGGSHFQDFSHKKKSS